MRKSNVLTACTSWLTVATLTASLAVSPDAWAKKSKTKPIQDKIEQKTRENDANRKQYRDLEAQLNDLKANGSRTPEYRNGPGCDVCAPGTNATCDKSWFDEAVRLHIAGDGDWNSTPRRNGKTACEIMYKLSLRNTVADDMSDCVYMAGGSCSDGACSGGSCGPVKLQLAIADKQKRLDELEKQIKDTDDEVSNLQASLDGMDDSDDSDGGSGSCVICDGTDGPMRAPSAGEKAIGIIQSITPILLGGASVYMGIRGMDYYAKGLQSWYQHCNTLGVPCGGPNPAAFMGGGGMMGMSGGMMGMGGIPGGYMMGGIPGGYMMGGMGGIGVAIGTAIAGGIPGGIPGGYMMGGVPGGYMMGGVPGGYMMGGVPGGYMMGGVPGGYMMGGVPGGYMMGGVPGGYMMGGVPGGYMMGGIPGGFMMGGLGQAIGTAIAGGFPGGYMMGGVPGGYMMGGVPGGYMMGGMGGMPGGYMMGGMGGMPGGYMMGGMGGFPGGYMMGGMGGFPGGYMMGMNMGMNAQYMALMQASMQAQMAQMQRAMQVQQNLMMAQQQIVEAQMRYYQTLQSLYSMGSMTFGSGVGAGFGYAAGITGTVPGFPGPAGAGSVSGF